MRRPCPFAALLSFLCLTALPTSALADRVLVLPGQNNTPNPQLTSRLQSDTSLALSELGHQMVQPSELPSPGPHLAESAEDYGRIGQQTRADWVLRWTLSGTSAPYQLELMAHQVRTGRTESLSRFLLPEKLLAELKETAQVLLRAQGVGTEPLPWEHLGPLPPVPVPKPASPPAASPPIVTSTSAQAQSSFAWGWYGAVGLGPSVAIKRPEGAQGSTWSTDLMGQLGVQLTPETEVGLEARGAATGPRATQLTVSGRYLVPVLKAPRLRLGPELGPGLFVMHAGAQQTSFLLRASAVASLELSERVSVRSSLGDVSWVPASSGTLWLAGATLQGVIRF